MKLNFKKIKHHSFNILSFIIAIILILTSSSCKKVEIIDNPIAIVYKDGVPYIINDKSQTISLEQYDFVDGNFDNYIGVKKNNKWGFIKNTGEPVTDIKYDKVGRMAENKAVVVEKGTTYIINEKGDILYTFKDKITSYSYFSENKLIIEKNGLLGYLEYNVDNSSFSILVEPQYIYADLYHEGFATIGMEINNNIKYNYLTSTGELFISEFIFDEASYFSCGLAKVGFNNSSMKYSFLKSNLSDLNEPQYLTNSITNEIISCDYAADFSNGIAFIAEYREYNAGMTEDMYNYRWYSMVDNSGNFSYEKLLGDIMKAVPKNFYPHSPIYIENVLVFINGYRSSNVWNFYRYTKYLQPNENNDFFEVELFDNKRNIGFNLTEEQQIVKELMKENNWTFALAKSILGSPAEANNFKYNEVLDCYIASVKISNDKMGIIKITAEPLTENIGNSLDTHYFKIEYVISAIYDNIIY